MEKTIKIEGLNRQQMRLADLLWKCESNLQVAAILAIFGNEARVVRDLMIAASMDTVDDTDLAKQVLDQFRL